MAESYYTADQLRTQGERVRDKAIQITVEVEWGEMRREMGRNRGNDPQWRQSHPIEDPMSGVTIDMVRDYATQEYANVPGYFEWFARPNPAGILASVDSLWRAAYTLDPAALNTVLRDWHGDPIPTGATTLKTGLTSRLDIMGRQRMAHWSGDAAEQFSAYLTRCKDPITPQMQVAAVLATALDAHKQAWDSVHRSIWEIGDKTVNRLEALKHSCDGDDVVAMIAVGAAVTGVLLAAPEALALTPLAKLGKETGALVNQLHKNVKVSIGGGMARAVIASMCDGILKLSEEIEAADRVIAQYVTKMVSHFPSSKDLAMPEPAGVSQYGGGKELTATPGDFYPA